MRHTVAAALAVAVMTVAAGSAQQKPTHADPDKPVQGSGKLPGDWNVRFDKPEAKPEMVNVKEEQNALTFKTGPAGIYYKSGMKAEGDYELSASFSQLDPAELPRNSV